jgi:hypothetical protein
MLLGVKGQAGLLWTDWGGKNEAICILFFPLLLRLVFVYPGMNVGKEGFVYCVGGACCVPSFLALGMSISIFA